MVYHNVYIRGVVWDKKEIHLVSDLVQPKVIIRFGLHNQKIMMPNTPKLQEDQKRRDFIQNSVQKNMRISSGAEGIARIEIQKRRDLIQVIIYMGFPKLLIESRPRGAMIIAHTSREALN